MHSYYAMDILETLRKLKRYLEAYFTYRRALILLMVVFCLILYGGPMLFRWISRKSTNQVKEIAERCLSDRLLPFYFENEEFNANILHVPKRSNEKPYLPFVGNGIFGLDIYSDRSLYIKKGRTLSVSVPVSPLVEFSLEPDSYHEATVVQYITGILYKFQCFSSGSYISYQYYAHRTLPSVLVQDIKITNPTSEPMHLRILPPNLLHWPSADSHMLSFQQLRNSKEYMIVAGSLPIPNSDDVIAVCLVMRKLLQVVEVKPLSSLSIDSMTVINYSVPISRNQYEYEKEAMEKKAVEQMKIASMKEKHMLKESHAAVWNQLWSTGITISYSKAADAINGDKINATMYYVLSQVPAPIYEEVTKESRKPELANILFYAEGCYQGYHTLQAANLWNALSTFEEIDAVASLWLLTLEKQGCHNLLKAGASGAAQAMVLSFGSLRFSNQHLELNIHPKYLHRDYTFRRVSYGNLTHVNISIVVKDDNKAVLCVALDRSDKNYYACDGGCLDDPVQLGPHKTMFPVKLTDPVTAILYITYDKKHMEDLRHAIHVKEVVEAPPHEHHVIALHKHGHHLGGLPTLFWVSICFLITVFHLFLCKLIYNEYCGSQDKYRTSSL
ncbi:uncharacterized protein KIAA2013 homolog isoform X3 [Hetaerina americana]|uniref:uncharacterized protein KIAA2013 homolog isoform X3 n=1 Tax=Hetaerina americana TaxID=62018 RepID=UPI003A7F5F8B